MAIQLIEHCIVAFQGALSFVPLTGDHGFYAALMSIGSLIVWRVR
jgi:hypothetical protein